MTPPSFTEYNQLIIYYMKLRQKINDHISKWKINIRVSDIFIYKKKKKKR